MKRHIAKWICLAIAVIVLDQAAGRLLRRLYFTQSQGLLHNITTAIETQTADILIMGSSRAMHHYDPDLISAALNMSCFNAGNDGQGIAYHKAVFDAICIRHTPRIVLLDVNHYELSHDELSYNLLCRLNPYAARHPQLWSVLSLRPHERVKHLSRIYPFNSMAARIIMGNLSFRTKDVSDNGFTAKYGQWNQPPLDAIFDPSEPLDSVKVNLYAAFVASCKAKGIRLIVVVSPLFSKVSVESASIACIRRICERENIPIVSFINESAFADARLFHDPTHLNAEGASIFSAAITLQIAPELKTEE